MDLHGRSFSEGEVTNLARLVTGAEFSRDRATREAHRELLADLTVGVLNDVARVAVDANEPGDVDFNARLFKHLTTATVSDSFAGLHGAAGNGPETVVSALDEQNSIHVVDNYGGRRGYDSIGPRG